MKKLFTILFLFSLTAAKCQKVTINGSGTTVTINQPGNDTVLINEAFAPAMFPIEYKLVSGDTASAIVIRPEFGTVDYDYLNYEGSIIASSSLAINTRRPLQFIKNDVFSSLSLTDLQGITYDDSPETTGYEAFGNLIHLGGLNYAWSGRLGQTHVTDGRIVTHPFSSLNRTFGTRVEFNRPVSDGTGVRGGSHTVINDQIYFFSSLYNSVEDTFICLTLRKSVDLTGVTWEDEDTLLFKAGTHGGIDETEFDRFNFYGTPVNLPGTQTWFLPWFEHNNSVTWRVNYIYTEDNFATWETRNVSESSVDQIGEISWTYCGNNTLFLLGRFDGNREAYQNVSYDLGATWEGWQRTNLGSRLGRVIVSVLHTEEFGLISVYADRGTDNIMLSKNNNLADVVAFPLTWNTPEIIYTAGAADVLEPLGYPSIIKVAQSRYMISFSIEFTGAARLFVGDGKP